MLRDCRLHNPRAGGRKARVCVLGKGTKRQKGKSGGDKGTRGEPIHCSSSALSGWLAHSRDDNGWLVKARSLFTSFYRLFPNTFGPLSTQGSLWGTYSTRSMFEIWEHETGGCFFFSLSLLRVLRALESELRIHPGFCRLHLEFIVSKSGK